MTNHVCDECGASINMYRIELVVVNLYQGEGRRFVETCGVDCTRKWCERGGRCQVGWFNGMPPTSNIADGEDV